MLSSKKREVVVYEWVQKEVKSKILKNDGVLSSESV